MIWLISSGRKTCVVARSVTDGGMQDEAVYRVMLLSAPAPMLSPVHEQCISLTAVGNMSNSNQAANSLTVIIATSASLLAAFESCCSPAGSPADPSAQRAQASAPPYYSPR